MEGERKGGDRTEMWVFGYGSLIWKAGFRYNSKLVGFVRGYRRVFYQGSTDHRGTPSFPGRTVTLEPAPDGLCWGVAYQILGEDDKKAALEHLEVREKQYDRKVLVHFFTDPSSATPAVPGVMVYIASSNKRINVNYLGPASVEDIARQIVRAKGPSGENREYLFELEKALVKMGCVDEHVKAIAAAVRKTLSQLSGPCPLALPDDNHHLSG